MATTSVTPNQDAVVSEIHIAAPPERVFQALIDPKQVMSWWTGSISFLRVVTLSPTDGKKQEQKSPRAKVSCLRKHCVTTRLD